MKKLQLIILLSLLSLAAKAQVTANFIASNTIGCLPDATIEFTNQSTSVEPVASYSWDVNGIASSTDEHFTYTFTQSGLYGIQLSVTDVSGNLDTYSIIVNIAEAPVVTLTSTPTPLSCNNTSVVLEANPSYPNTTNTWFDPNGNVISNSTEVFVSNAGTYTFEITHTQTGCSSSSTIEVVATNNYPVAVIQNPTVLSCSNPIVTLDGTGSSPSPDYTYEWKIGNTVISTDLMVDVSYAGLYTLEVTNGAMPWCSSSAQVNVMNDGSGPTLNIPTTPDNDTLYNCQETFYLSEDLVDASCTTCTVEIRNADDGLICNSLPCATDNGSWYPLPLKIIVTDNATGCFTATILETPQSGSASMSAGITNESCLGGDGAIDLFFTGTAGPYNFDWFDIPGTNNSLNRTDLVGGTYYLLITSATGCPVFTDSLGLDFEVESTAVIADATASDSVFSIFCNTVPPTPIFNLDASNSSMGADIIYQWFDAGNNLVGEGITTEVYDPGVYTLVVTDTVTQCSNSTNRTLTVFEDLAAPIADAGPPQTLNCNTPIVTLDGSGSSMGPEYTYIWIDSSGNVLSTGITVDVNQPGVYTLEVTDNSNGCISSSMVEVLADTTVPIFSTSMLSCSGEITITPNNVCAGCTIEIYDSNGMLICDMLPCTYTAVAGVSYTVTVTDPNSGCSNTTIVINDLLDVEANLTNASCNGGTDGSIDLTVMGGGSIYEYLWSTGENTQDISGLTASTYTVTVTDLNGCEIIETFTINEVANLGISITNDTTICAGETVDLEVWWIPAVVLPVEWTPSSTLNNNNITNPTAAPTETTLYTVVVTESTGCTVQTEVLITVDDSCVWPGDTDTNKVVNNFDLLNIGLAFDSVGPSRTGATLNWTGQQADDWTQTTPTTNVNYKHIDTDGNGMINSDDTLAIVQNWGLTHNFTGTTVFDQFTDLPIADGGNVLNAPFYVEPDTLPEGETIGLDIILGDMSNVIIGLYGIAFSIEYDPTVVVPGSASIDFSNCWLGDVNADAISIQRDFSTPGRIDAAITRTDGMEMDGAGLFGSFIITLEDDILLWDPKIDEIENEVFADFKITNYHLINFAQEEILVEGLTTTAPVRGDGTTSIHNTYLEQQIQLYPNPANELFFISSSKNLFIENVKIYSTTKMIKAMKTKTNDVIKIPTMDLPNGIYFIELQTEKGVVTKKVSIVR